MADINEIMDVFDGPDQECLPLELKKVPTQKQIWEAWTPPDNLQDCVKLFFEILDSKEFSENSGQMFHPTKFNAEEKVINSIRVWDCHRLNKLLPKMKELANGLQLPKM